MKGTDMDEDTNAPVIDEEVVEDVSQEAPEEEQPEEQEQEQPEEQEVEEEAPQEEEQPEEPAPSRREQLRVQQLLNKYPNLNERVAPTKPGINYRDMIEADPEVYQQLDTASQQYGEQQYNQGLEEARFLSWRTDLKIETPQVNAKHPQLDSSSDSFNPALSDSINQMYLNFVGYDGKKVRNPNISYSDYVESIFELADEAAGQKVQSAQRNIAKQASRTGLRPDGSSAKRLDLSKSPEAMTDEELDAVIAQSGFKTKKR